MSEQILKRYYAAFNSGDAEGMLALVDEDLLHEPSQGDARRGRDSFAAFLVHMNRCYEEKVLDPVYLCSADGQSGAVEFRLIGRYLVTDGDLPQANGQQYALRVGAFFEFREGKISRVSNHYNLTNWLAQVAVR